MDDEYPNFEALSDRQSAQVIQIDSGKHISAVAICSAFCAVAACLAAWAAFQSVYATKRADMLQYYVMELDGKLMAAGVIKYEESWAAQQRRQPEQERKP